MLMNHIMIIFIISIALVPPQVVAMDLHKAKPQIKWELLNGTRRSNCRVIAAARNRKYRIQSDEYRPEYEIWNIIDNGHHYARSSQWIERIEYAFALGADVNYDYPHTQPLFHMLMNRLGITRIGKQICGIFIQNGFNPNLIKDDGETALMAAVKESWHSGICKLLLAAHADVLAQDKDGNTALHFAAKKRDHRKLWLLITHQQKQETLVVTLLACLRHNQHASGRMLYHLRKDLLKPYLLGYTVKPLINAINNKGQTAYNCLPLECFIPPQFQDTPSF